MTIQDAIHEYTKFVAPYATTPRFNTHKMINDLLEEMTVKRGLPSGKKLTISEEQEVQWSLIACLWAIIQDVVKIQVVVQGMMDRIRARDVGVSDDLLDILDV